jgi:hypothetical protein
MEKGRQALHAGQLRAANTEFGFAVCATKDDDKKASALQMRGITLRLDKQYPAAEAAFRVAAHLANDDTLKARILRDLGMVQLNQAVLKKDPVLFEDASKSFTQSYKALLEAGATIEAAVSHGFRGRVCLEQGKRMRAHAREILIDAHLMLANQHDTYELNNLLWLMRATPVIARFRYFSRARRLIELTRQTRRRKEFLAVMIGGDFLYKVAHTFVR